MLLLLQVQCRYLFFHCHLLSFLCQMFSVSSSSPPRYSDFNVVFAWSISLNDFAPSIPITLSVNQPSFVIVSSLFSFFGSVQLISSVVNVLFVFSVSLNNFAPSILISLSIIQPSIHSFLRPFVSSRPKFIEVNDVFILINSLSAFAPSFLMLLPVVQSSLFVFISLLFSIFLTTQIHFSQYGFHFWYFAQCCCSFVPNLITCFPNKRVFFSSFLSFFYLTAQIQWCQCGVHVEYFIQYFCSFDSNIIVCQVVSIRLFINWYSCFLSSPSILSDVNVVFTWSVSFIDLTPSTPIPLSIIQPSLTSVLLRSFYFFLTPQIQWCQRAVHLKHLT